jgi:hypothetical protein
MLLRPAWNPKAEDIGPGTNNYSVVVIGFRADAAEAALFRSFLDGRDYLW